MYSNNLICDILEYISKNINLGIKIDDLVSYTYYNRFYIMKLFKKEIKIPIYDYINIRRIYNSLKQVQDSDYSFYRIGIENGFNSLEYFSETFKKIIGVAPSIYKKVMNKNVDTKVENIDIVKEHLLKIQNIINYSDKYLLRRKPSKIIPKKLTIFK